jgi:hypothetical protein
VPIPDIIDVDPPQGRVPALIAAAGARISRRFFEFFAVNVRNPHTRRAQDRSAEQSARSRRKYRRRFRRWDISANVGVKVHAQVEDKMTRFMAEAAAHFSE